MLYKNGTKEKRIKEIEEKLSNKTATKAEYDELKQIKKVSANIEKVSNIIEYKYKRRAYDKIYNWCKRHGQNENHHRYGKRQR